MANGDIHKLGTLYVNNTKRQLPTKPWRTDIAPSGAPSVGNILKYDSVNGSIEIRNTDTNDEYKLRWVEVNDGYKKLLISDRCLLSRVTWDELNAQGLISGKEIIIDGRRYKIRLLKGGIGYRNGTDGYGGGMPTTNEWDRIITNENSVTGLPKPTNTDLDSTQNATDLNSIHNQFWNWYHIYSWCQDVYSENSSSRIVRGSSSARFLNQGSSDYRGDATGWRPVLEVIKEPLPNIPITSSLAKAITHVHDINEEIGYQSNKLGEILTEKGVEVLQSDKMSNLIDKVGSIATGKKWASISTTIDIRDITTSSNKFKTIPINIGFIPTEVFVTMAHVVPKEGPDITYRPLHGVTVSSKANYSRDTAFSAGGTYYDPYRFYITNITNNSFDFNYYSSQSNAPDSVTKVEIEIYGN